MKNSLAVIGAVIAILSGVPYMIDVIRHKSKPNIVSWFTWTLLTAIATAAAFAEHAPHAALLTLGSTISTGMVVLLGLKFGIAKLTRFDALFQAGAVVGLVIWLLLSSPTAAIVITMIIDFIAALPTIRHGWLKPGEETWQTFALSGVAAAFVFASLVTYTFADLAFPVYLFFANSLIVAIIIYRRKQKGISLTR